MRNQDDKPRYWRRWLQEQGVTQRIERSAGQFHGMLRRAQERMWTFAYAGALGGAMLGVIVTFCFVGLSLGRRPALASVAIIALAAAVASSLAWWIAYLFMHRARMHGRFAGLTGIDLQDEQAYADVVVDAVAEGLAGGQSKPRDEQREIDQLTQATMIKGLREAPTSELERQLLERLVGSAFVPTAEGGIFVFKPGPSCARCGLVTRAGPLRILNVPSHWAAENRYPRANDLPPRGRHLRTVPERTLELTEFVGPAAREATRPTVFGPDSELLLCEDCAKQALGQGLARETSDHRR